MRTFGEGAPLLMLAGAGGRGAGFMPLARAGARNTAPICPIPARPLRRRRRRAGCWHACGRRAWSGLMCWARRWAAVRRWRWPLWRRSRVRSLTLCAAFARLDEETAGRLAALRGRRLALPDDAFDAEWMDLLYGDMPRPAGSGGVPADALAAQLEAALAFDGRPLLPRIRCPVCVTFGREDRRSRRACRGSLRAGWRARRWKHIRAAICISLRCKRRPSWDFNFTTGSFCGILFVY